MTAVGAVKASAARARRHLDMVTGLLENRALSDRLPDEDQDVTPENSILLDEAVRWLKSRRLVNEQAAPASVRHRIRRCMSEIRGKRDPEKP